MNLRLLTIAFLLTVTSFKVFANETKPSLTKSDFSHAEEVVRNEKAMVELNLSQTGKEKVKQLNQSYVGKKVSLKLNGKEEKLTLRVPIADGKMEVGPFTHAEAKKIVDEINKK
ncbi:MAG TPA: hypothetical protein VF412_16775 [Bdellovibrio sp.]|uniref:hypothetical protein n=1 Tax=Bdellovibrio sp. TaxID=28201 RepID=UPI002EFE7B46